MELGAHEKGKEDEESLLSVMLFFVSKLYLNEQISGRS
jgi:hypothetical protein